MESAHETDIKITISDRILSATVLTLFPKWVTPNQITVFRFFTVPFVLFLVFIEQYKIGLILFAISAFTDALDGALARTTNRVTEWGKIYDPVADKLLIGTTALVLVPRHLGFGIVFAVLFIEMLTIGGAYYFKNKGVVAIQANGWGKAKMFCQSLGVGFAFLYTLVTIPVFFGFAQAFLYFSIPLAVMSLLMYGI